MTAEAFFLIVVFNPSASDLIWYIADFISSEIKTSVQKLALKQIQARQEKALIKNLKKM